jgi:hypothetical protein
LIAAEIPHAGSTYSQVCLLQHDIVDVHPRYKGKVLLEEDALPKKVCVDLIEKVRSSDSFLISTLNEPVSNLIARSRIWVREVHLHD